MIVNILTGRRRVRTLHRWRKPDVLVLEIEVHQTGYYMSFAGLSPVAIRTDVDRKIWRDACVGDLTVSETSLDVPSSSKL